MTDMDRVLGGGLVFLIFIVLCIGYCSIGYMNTETTTCQVEDKWIKNYDRDGVYLVDCGKNIYKISDLFWKAKFDSSDIYGKLEKGKTYKITTSGFRIPILSEYKNINKVEKVR